MMNLQEVSILELLKELRARDCAVVCFVPDELNGAHPEMVEDRLVEVGWEIIDSLSTDSNSEDEWEGSEDDQ